MSAHEPAHCEPPPCPSLTDQLTVEAWIEIDATRTETMQAVVSKWEAPEAFGRFDAFDASATDGLNCVGYFGAGFDGRYIYFSPEHHDDGATHGIVLRYDTHAPFDEAASYEAYDASDTSGLVCRGYYGAAFDGRYVYFSPRQIDLVGPHSHLLRYDTESDFRDAGAWSAFDVGRPHTSQSAGFDGRYLYLCPGYNDGGELESTNCGEVIRYDTQAPFEQAASYAWFDVSSVGGPTATCFDGAAFDGRWMYFVPLSQSVAVRYDTTRPFTDGSSWECHDLQPLGLGMCVGAVFDGRYLYYAPYQNSRVVRFDTTGDFNSPDAFACYDADHTDGLRTAGYDGAYFDGRFVHFIPFIRDDDGEYGFKLHGNLLRYDTVKPFEDAQSWRAVDHASTSGIPSYGYNGGAFDGRYFYSSPWRLNEGPNYGAHGNVLRHDTLGDGGSFSLRAGDVGHNGGLCAATPGPSFLVNTTMGVVSATLHRALNPGAHHLAGTYDGRCIRLYLDGECVAERAATGAIQQSSAPITVGALPAGAARLVGRVVRAQVEASALGADEIATHARGGG